MPPSSTNPAISSTLASSQEIPGDLPSLPASAGDPTQRTAAWKRPAYPATGEQHDGGGPGHEAEMPPVRHVEPTVAGGRSLM